MSVQCGSNRRALLTGAAAIGAVAAGGAAIAPAVAGAGPDAELIALCGEYAVAVDAHNADGGHLEMEDCPLWQATEALRLRLDGMAACTLAGVVAKARVARTLAQQPSGEDYSDAYTGEWPGEVVRELLRLSEGAAA